MRISLWICWEIYSAIFNVSSLHSLRGSVSVWAYWFPTPGAEKRRKGKIMLLSKYTAAAHTWDRTLCSDKAVHHPSRLHRNEPEWWMGGWNLSKKKAGGQKLRWKTRSWLTLTEYGASPVSGQFVEDGWRFPLGDHDPFGSWAEVLSAETVHAMPGTRTRVPRLLGVADQGNFSRARVCRNSTWDGQPIAGAVIITWGVMNTSHYIYMRKSKRLENVASLKRN